MALTSPVALETVLKLDLWDTQMIYVNLHVCTVQYLPTE